MKRDFSSRSKEEIISLVSEVEGHKITNFTDWNGDGWNQYAGWINELGINQYIRNVNKYHKDVINKNNESIVKIGTIFDNAHSIDQSYQSSIQELDKLLSRWVTYGESLAEMVDPSKGNFNAKFISRSSKNNNTFIAQGEVDYIKHLFNNDTEVDSLICRELLDEISDKSIFDMTDSEKELLIKVYLNPTIYNELYINAEEVGFADLCQVSKKALTMGKILGKVPNDGDAKILASGFSYVSSLVGLMDSTDKDTLKIFSDWFKLGQATTKLENGYFDYKLKKLKWFDARKLDNKFGHWLKGFKIAGDIFGISSAYLDTLDIFADFNSTVYDKSAQWLKFVDSIIESLGDIYLVENAGDKVLKVAGKASEIGGQKVISQGLEYALSSEAAKKVEKAGTALAITDVALSSVAGGLKRYGEVAADGEVSATDVGSVGVHGSLAGLDKVTRGLSFGAIGFDSEKVAGELDKETIEFVNTDNALSNYIKDQNNSKTGRFLASLVAAEGMIGEKVIEGTTDCMKTIVHWGRIGLEYATNFLG